MNRVDEEIKDMEVMRSIVELLFPLGTEGALQVLGRLTNGIMHTIPVDLRMESMDNWIEILRATERDMQAHYARDGHAIH